MQVQLRLESSTSNHGVSGGLLIDGAVNDDGVDGWYKNREGRGHVRFRDLGADHEYCTVSLCRMS